jgi:hypothetical protein
LVFGVIFRSEVFALLFGVLLFLITFGDNHLGGGSIALVTWKRFLAKRFGQLWT